MQLKDFKKISERVPDAPGVYFFLGPQKEILYIGKATSLRSRVRSYFSRDLVSTRGQLLVDMVSNAKNIDWRQTDTVLEALILEASLIKNYQPKHNTQEKDDKSFNYVVITEEDFPRVLTVRGKNLKLFSETTPIKTSFGPFTQGTSLREALKIIRKIFPFRDTCTPINELKDKGKARACFNAQIGLCPGVCVGSISKKEYTKTVKHIIQFFEGKKKKLVSDLQKEMKTYAEKLQFEEASEVKRTIFALEHINDVALIKEDLNIHDGSQFRIEAYDIAHLSGTNVVGSMTVVENGHINKAEYRKFKVRGDVGTGENDDVNNLKEILERRLAHSEWRTPNLIVVDGSAPQLNAAKEVVAQMGFKIDCVAVTKNERHKPKHVVGDEDIIQKFNREIVLANSEAHRFAVTFHRKKRDVVR